MKPNSSTNLRNRVKKLYLPKTKALYPLFEIISNSIHAIDEKKIEINNPNFKGRIEIKIIRNGSEDILKQLEDIEKYPINSFSVTDNGIGLNDENIQSFAEFDSEKKAKIGGKGVGRLVCLKAFDKIIADSTYQSNGSLKVRQFNYRKSKEGFDKYEENLDTKNKKTGTNIILSNYELKYQKHVTNEMMEIGRQVITHFQLYFIQKIEPEIIIRNQDDTEINLTSLFNREFQTQILNDEFTLANQSFQVFISKSLKALSHKIHYCAHQRTVKDEYVAKYLEDLKYKIRQENEDGFYFQIFVVGGFLDKNVNEARTGFYFATEEDDENEDLEEITLSKIRKNTISSIEKLLSNFLTELRKEKLDKYLPIIKEEFPNYTNVISNNLEKVKKLPVGLSKQELDIKLYEIESEWKLNVRKEGVELIDNEKDITQLEDYKKLYDKFLSQFNDIGQSDLARYVVHRRSVIDLLDKLIELNQNEKFANEDIVHSLFFPIRETNETISSDKQNLWLLDERLTFNSLLASDKLFKQVDQLNSDSKKRMDLIIQQGEVFENATLFSEDKFPFESFTIVEFKKPERDDYKQGDIKKDPVKQVRKYVEEIIAGKEKKNGKPIKADRNTPFYCYIVADITPTLENILDYESFDPTPDGLGYFRFYETKTSRAYVEVMPFQKIIKDAKQRNKILFDKLNLI
ncbi:MAG: ATP-binding protein [Flavobacteriaceae bacterium]